MQKTIVVMEDDLDGSAAAQTITFSVDGTDMKIDLSDEHADEFRKVLEPYVNAAQVTGGKRQSRRRRANKTEELIDNRAVRAWAASNGVELSSRGRIPSSIIEQYRQAGN
jgi:hypothetical protein